ncbi:16S rRNA (guanine(527)-N(7))-methyltransferase RsmG, partial [Solemya velum gill symbiont]
MDQKEELARGIEALGVTLSQEQQKKLLDFLALLYKWNSAYNLTAIRDQEQAVALQLLDSLAILPLLPEGPILDIGSGGGMPGI